MNRQTAIIVLASLAPLAGIQAATLLTPGSTQILYTLGESGADFSTNFTDASGNNRNMLDGTPSGATWTSGGMTSGSTASLMIVDNKAKYTMDNASGVSSDYQVTIFLSSDSTWDGHPDPTGVQTVFAMDGIRFFRQGETYYGEVNGATVGSLTTTAWAATGLMFQKVNDVFSFWTSSNSGTSWTQQGSDVTAAGLGDNWASTHLFIKPGSGENYWGYADNFKVVAVVPEPAAALLGGLGLFSLLRRRRG